VGLAYLSDPNEARFHHVVHFFRQAADEQRRSWAKDPNWFYFGYNPPEPLHALRTTHAIEAEIWRLWILSEDFKTIGVGKFDQDGMPDGMKLGAGGNSKIALDKILDRLVEIGVVSSRGPDDSRKLNRLWKLDAEVTDIEGEVDSEKELASIRKWAAERKPELLGGQISGVPRTILPLDISNIPTR
jgi:hypothetical protein